MPETPKAPPTKVEVQPGEDIWTALARELSARPEGPVALGVMSQINKGIRPRQDAYTRLVEACARKIEEPGNPAVSTEIDLAKENWSEVCKEDLAASTLKMAEEEAEDLVEHRLKQPPEMSRILLDGADGRRDYGYELGGDLTGLQGTWHRLWALISMDRYFGHTLPTADVSELRLEFEAQLGRELAPVEWHQLVEHAHRHSDKVMKPRFPDGDISQSSRS